MTEKYKESLSELNIYYKRKESDAFLWFIISWIPVCSIIMNALEESIPLLNCVVIVSAIEVLVIFFAVTDLIKHESVIYFIENNRRIYVYEKVNSDTVICGDNCKISEAEKYVTISYDELKNMRFFIRNMLSYQKKEKSH